MDINIELIEGRMRALKVSDKEVAAALNVTASSWSQSKKRRALEEKKIDELARFLGFENYKDILAVKGNKAQEQGQIKKVVITDEMQAQADLVVDKMMPYLNRHFETVNRLTNTVEAMTRIIDDLQRKVH